MPYFMCCTCGTEHDEQPTPPALCRICSDERQYVAWDGQAWTTHEQLAAHHRPRIERDHALLGVGLTPPFAIPQRALHLPEAGVLWESTALVTDEAVAALQRQGGVERICISHPHFYSAMVRWSEALGGVPVLLHENDRAWVQRHAPCLEFWRGDTLDLGRGARLLRCPGHFPGSTVLHWDGGANGRPALLAGDALHVARDRRHVSFMYSVPNHVPARPALVRETQARLRGLAFEDVYGFTWGLNIVGDGRAAVDASFERYFDQLG
ncbi:MAG: MBL fold metallo-hydrolase [Roseateles depolymerans]|uniref:MBL fold metallo-hydrolase n=1 Tax=Roseateles depolymerans TaxID=76731 RepID=A0A2W5DQJ5_9BURK|nr:MAG: MBL fold metallo-hydrolase [Roseateles depolymerans]